MSKEIIPRKYNEEEQKFIHKYGESSFLIWETLSDSQKADYFELEQLYSDFFELYRDHYDDLKYYALMYRNVPLYNITNDLLSMNYFASKKDEIVGYKKKVLKDKSLKGQIVKLYYENEALFPKVCIKYADVNFQINRKYSNDWDSIFEALREIRTKEIPHVLSVNDMTDTQCMEILNHKSSLTNDYSELCDQYLGDISIGFDLFKDSNDRTNFCLNKLIPILLNEDSGKESLRDILLEYISQNFGGFIKSCVRDELKRIESYYSRIKTISNEHQDLVKEKEKLTAQKDMLQYEEPTRDISEIRKDGLYGLFRNKREEIEYLEDAIHSYEWLGRGQNEEELKQLIHKAAFPAPFEKPITLQDIEKKQKENKEAEATNNKIKERIKLLGQELSQKRAEISVKVRAIYDQIHEIDAEILKKNKDIENIKAIVAKDVPHYNICSVIYDYQDNVNKFINDIYEKKYNMMWSNTPDEIREKERQVSGTPYVRYFILSPIDRRRELHGGSCNHIYRSFISRKTNKPDCCFSSSLLMTQWCNIFETEKKKQEELKRKEQEEKRRIEEERRKQEEEKRRREEEARLERFRYNKRNRHSRDYYISFDEATHIYKVGGITLQSVTNIVENCFPKFDAQLHAKTTAAKMGMTEEEVIAMWERKGKESRELGTVMHQKIESYYQGQDSGEDDAFRLFKVFAEKVKLEPYRTEWAVYDTDYNIAGTIDFVDCQDGIFTIYDWKRSDKIIANGMPVKVSKYQEKGLYPLEHLENCAYYHYALQLSLYKFILEKNYDIKVSDLRLGIFHPSYDKPYVLKMPYLENEVKTLMELRSEVLL